MTSILITGANRGLGLEFVRQYADEDVRIIAACRNPKKADELQKLAAKHDNIRIEKLDVADFDAISAIADKLKGETVDILINNAGILSGAKASTSPSRGDDSQSLGSVDPEAWLKVVRTNVLSPIKMTEAFLPHVKKGAQKKVVMISSGWGSIANMDGGWYAYRPSKAMLNAVTKNLAADLENLKIGVFALAPGWVQTDMGGNDANITPKESIAGMRKVIAGLNLKKTGQYINYDGKTIPW